MHEKEKTNGFMLFLREQNVIGLAIGLVMGTAAAAVVNSLINNVIMPPIGLLLGSTDGIRGLAVNIATKPGQTVMWRYGQFINDAINFIIIALVIYIIVVKIMKLDTKKK